MKNYNEINQGIIEYNYYHIDNPITFTAEEQEVEDFIQEWINT